MRENQQNLMLHILQQDLALMFHCHLDETYDTIRYVDINGKLLNVQVKYPKEFEHGFVLVGKTNLCKYMSEDIDGVSTIYDVLYYVPV